MKAYWSYMSMRILIYTHSNRKVVVLEFAV